MKNGMLDLENMLCNEKKDKEEREKVRRKVLRLIGKASKEVNKRDNLTTKERKRMESLKVKREIALQPVDKS